MRTVRGGKFGSLLSASPLAGLSCSPSPWCSSLLGELSPIVWKKPLASEGSTPPGALCGFRSQPSASSSFCGSSTGTDRRGDFPESDSPLCWPPPASSDSRLCSRHCLLYTSDAADDLTRVD